MIAKEVWHKHPGELEGQPYCHQMALDYIALNLLEAEEVKAKHG